MNTATAVAETVAVIASIDDVKQPAGGSTIGIVIDGEQSTKGIDTGSMRVPEPCRDAHEPRPIVLAAVDASPFSLARQRHAVGTDEFVRSAEILTESDVHVPGGIEGKSGQPVMWIV